jgi:penicillin-binding protein 2
MVDNRPSFDIGLEYEALKDRKPAVDLLSHLLKMTSSEIDQILTQYRGPAYLSIPVKKDVDMTTLTQVEEARLQVPSITVEVNPVRKYVLKETACTVLGYVGAIDKESYQTLKDRGYHWLDVIGKTGIESACEVYLKGVSGGMQIEVDHRGHREQILNIKKPIPGRNVYLTIDMKIQKALEEALNNRKGSGLVMNPQTGEILGVVSKPSYDLNIFIKPDLRNEVVKLLKDSNRPLVNRAFQGIYGPGSIFKLIVVAAGLDTGLANKDTSVDCPGFYQIGGKVFRCWKEGGHGHVDLKTSIQRSCNVFFYHLGQRLGPDRIAEYARLFGLGKLTGLDIGNEREGLVPDPKWKREKLRESWYGGDTANYSIGQGFVTLTPIQLARMVSSIANGGKLLSPFLIKKVVLPEGRTLIEVESKSGQNLKIPGWILKKIREAMWATVNELGGTGYASRLDAVEVSGKTGTVEVKKGSEIVKLGWFVAFAPSKNPQIVLVLLVEGVDSAGRNVAPIAKRVLQRCFGITPPELISVNIPGVISRWPIYLPKRD